MFGDDSAVGGNTVASGVKGNSDVRGALRTLINLSVLAQSQEREGGRRQSQTGMDGELTHPLAVSTFHPDVSGSHSPV